MDKQLEKRRKLHKQSEAKTLLNINLPQTVNKNHYIRNTKN